MNSIVQKQAEQVLSEAVERAMGNGRIREKTRAGMRKVSEACHKIVDGKGELTISNVIRVMSELYPGNHPAEQSIRNNSPSGDAYKDIVAAWRTYVEAMGRAKKVSVTTVGREDFPDVLLNVVEPKHARLLILSMRTALRNMRRQFQIVQSVTPEKLIRHEAPAKQGDKSSLPPLPKAELSQGELEAVQAFLDDTEMASRGYSWDKMGRLCTVGGEVVSRPGLRAALEKAAKPL